MIDHDRMLSRARARVYHVWLVVGGRPHHSRRVEGKIHKVVDSHVANQCQFTGSRIDAIEVGAAQLRSQCRRNFPCGFEGMLTTVVVWNNHCLCL